MLTKARVTRAVKKQHKHCTDIVIFEIYEVR